MASTDALDISTPLTLATAPADNGLATGAFAFVSVSALDIEVLDVDTDAEARLRFGHKIPVLLFDGELVCHGHLDAEEVHKTLAHHRRPV